MRYLLCSSSGSIGGRMIIGLSNEIHSCSLLKHGGLNVSKDLQECAFSCFLFYTTGCCVTMKIKAVM